MLAAGKKLGPYEIVSSAGSGGMGEVYRARDTRLGRDVAIKVLPEGMASDPDLRQRFDREAKAISSLNHPHICALYDVGREDDTDYLVMEYMEGESLADRLQKGPLPIEQLMRYAIEIADALDAAHRQGVIHRDLKPANVFITRTGAKLLDFGLAKPNRSVLAAATAAEALTAMATQAAKPLTNKGTVVGTFQYMAPEQLEGRDSDARSDIFALGVVLYEMSTGKRAFDGKTQASIIAAILASEPPPVSSIQPLTPPALELLIKTCLAKDPEERYQSAHDVRLQLKQIASGSGSLTSIGIVPRKRREPWAWSLAIAATAVALFLAAYVALRSAPERLVVRANITAPENTEFEFVGDTAGPAELSPDGRSLAFVAKRSGKQTLWVRSLDSLTPLELIGTENANFPFWSPDGKYLAYFGDGKLKRVDASHGPGIAICDSVAGRGGTWGPDGTILFSPDFRSGIFRVSSSGGTPTEIVKLDFSQYTTYRWPQWMPDGKHFIFFAATHAKADAPQNGLFFADVNGSQPKLIMNLAASAIYASGHLLFLRENTLMAQKFDPVKGTLSGDPIVIAEQVLRDDGVWRPGFWAAENGGLVYEPASARHAIQLNWFDRKGSVTSAANIDVGVGLNEFSLSPSETSVAFVGDPVNAIWAVDLTRGTRTRITFTNFQHHSPVWSPDGKRLAYVRTEPNLGESLLLRGANGVGPEEVLLDGSKASDSPQRTLTDWSPDGKYLLYTQTHLADNNSEIWALPLTGERKPFPVVQTPGLSQFATFSPDSRYIVYSSNDTGRAEIYVTDFPKASNRWQVSLTGAFTSRWSRDGKMIYVYDVAGGAIFETPVSQQNGEVRLGRSEKAFPLAGVSQVVPVFAVTRDAKRVLIIGGGSAPAVPLVLVTDWTSALKK